ETATGHAHGPDPAPVRGVQADADLVEQDRVGGAVGNVGEAAAVVDAEGAAAAVVAALEADGVGGTGEGVVEPAGAPVGRVIAPRPAAAVQCEGDVGARVGGAEVDGDGIAADAPPALVAAVAGHVVDDAGLVQRVQVALFGEGQDEDRPVGAEA